MDPKPLPISLRAQVLNLFHKLRDANDPHPLMVELWKIDNLAEKSGSLLGRVLTWRHHDAVYVVVDERKDKVTIQRVPGSTDEKDPYHKDGKAELLRRQVEYRLRSMAIEREVAA